MKLEEFISQSLIEICNGIKKARSTLNHPNPIIAPARAEGKDVFQTRLIDFEILVAVNEKNELQINGAIDAKVNIGFAQGNGQASGSSGKETNQEQKNKICLSVPYFPEGISDKND
jgi:hypothetical protein